MLALGFVVSIVLVMLKFAGIISVSWLAVSIPFLVGLLMSLIFWIVVFTIAFFKTVV